ncbi:hypothetical protein GCM10010271_70180 [Streptomyces kurssanovii]|nr:hypothetical protein GCM10010271_70180 [Streptomyces kurssanovii]
MATSQDVQSEAAFFDAISAVFKEHPEAAGKYAIAKLSMEEKLGVDFDRQCGVSRVEGDRIITEFVDRPSPEPQARTRCVETDENGNCLSWVSREE